MPAAQERDLPRHPKDITAPWLTSKLRDQGILPKGQITTLRSISGAKWNIAETARLRLSYDSSAPADAPGSLFVKIRTEVDPYEDHYKGEYAFYAAELAGELPVPKCYGAFRDQHNTTCLLLEDLETTHDQPTWPLPATEQQYRNALADLARLHAHWWQDQLAAQDRTAAERRVDFLGDHINRLLPRFLATVGDGLSPDRQQIMQRVCEKLPNLLTERLLGDAPITRVHGDAHNGNILFARNTAKHACVFIDWEDWHTNPGAFDLAYMIAYHWFPERRTRLEIPMLKYYQTALNHRISAPYSWDQLVGDYRLGHLHNFVVPLFQIEMGCAPDIWWQRLEPLFLSFDDLNCADLMK